MTINELIKEISNRCELAQADVKRVINTLGDVVVENLCKDEELSLPNVGKFKTALRAARQARNPHTGETVEVPEKKVAKFVVASSLKKMLND